MTSNPSPAMLVADIGGTNCRLALSAPGALGAEGADGFAASHTYSTDDFPAPSDAIEAFYRETGADRAPFAALAVAGPVANGEARLTNSHWSFDGGAIASTCGFKRVILANDLEAQARGVLTLSEAEREQIATQPWRAEADTIAVVGPGTGLGVARLDPHAAKRVTPTEGGHVGFSPSDDIEMELLRLWRLHLGRVTNEHVISGPGLVRLYRALGALRDAHVDAIAGPEIMERALAETPDAVAEEAVERFAKILGAVSGDIALAQGATALVLVGGIPNAMRPILHRGGFRARFDQRGPGGILKSASTHVAVAKELGLVGARALLLDALAP